MNWIFGILLPLSLFSQEKMLRGATVLENGKSATIRLLLSSTINNPKWDVDYVNNRIQIDIPGLNVEGGGKFSQIDGEYIKSISSQEISDDILRVQVVYKNGIRASDFKKRVSLIKGDEELFLFIKEPLRVSVASNDVKEGSVPVYRDREKVLDNRVINLSSVEREDITSKTYFTGEGIAANMFAGSLFTQGGRGFLEKLTLIGLIFTIFSFLFIQIRKKKQWQTVNKNSDIKILDRCRLDSKKSLMVVDVGQEILLLGVTDRSITPIKTLCSHKNTLCSSESEKEKKIDRFLDSGTLGLGESFQIISHIDKGFVNDKEKES